MSLNKALYKGKNNSPQTILTASVTAAATSLPVADINAFPTPPNLITIGTDENAEVVRYNGISGSELTGCERGFYGTSAQAWDSSALVYRGFTAYDHDAVCDDLQNHEERLSTVEEKAVPYAGAEEGIVPARTAGGTTNKYLREDGTWTVPPNTLYTHPTGDGNGHVPATGTTNNGKVLKAGASANSAAWSALTPSDIGAANEAHAAAHASGGSDEITPASIGAEPADPAIMKSDEQQNMSAPLIAQSNTGYATAQVRNMTLSISDPTTLSNGELWGVYA